MSKLNPQKASAYVGPGVLRKGGKITPVPNGPLIKKKGPFKGSTLKAGGTIKKAVNGTTTKQTTTPPLSPYMQKRAAQDLVKQKNIRARDSILNRNANAQGLTREEVRAKQESDKKKPDVSPSGSSAISLEDARCKDYEETSKKHCGVAKEANRENKKQNFRKNGGPIKKAQTGTKEYLTQEGNTYTSTKKVNTANGPRYYQGKSPNMSFAMTVASDKSRKINDSIPKAKLSARALEMLNQKNGGKVKKAKAGAMIKRADGSMSRRGLWDNIRANKGSGKKPTKQMLVQEKKIKAKAKK